MKNRPIHENLDTSFVNLSALIKYLRRRQFVGSVKVQLNGYKADIDFLPENKIKVSEHDQISGRISEGEEALQRLLIRSREPGGSINVFQQTENVAKAPEKPVVTNKKPKPQVTKTPQIEYPIVDAEIAKPIPMPAEPPQKPSNGLKTKQIQTPKSVVKDDFTLPKVKKQAVKETQPTNGNGNGTNKNVATAKQKVKPPNFPFRLTNKVEEQARKNQKASNEDWQMLLNLTVELLGVIDKSLAQSKLDFTAALKKACSEIADDYPFLHPSAEKFEYANGKIKMTEQLNSKIFITSIIQAIHRVLEKIASSPKFAETHRLTTQRILAVMNKRQKLYDKLGISPQLNRILGI